MPSRRKSSRIFSSALPLVIVAAVVVAIISIKAREGQERADVDHDRGHPASRSRPTTAAGAVAAYSFAPPVRSRAFRRRYSGECGGSMGGVKSDSRRLPAFLLSLADNADDDGDSDATATAMGNDVEGESRRTGRDSASTENPRPRAKTSHIVSIRSSNLAGMTSADAGGDIEVFFGDEPSFVAVTGESGSGKSLLISKAIDLVTGGKAVSSMVGPPLSLNKDGDEQENTSTTTVELTINLHEPHLSAVASTMENYGLDPNLLFAQPADQPDELPSATANGNRDRDSPPDVGRLILHRTLSWNDASNRVKSVCRINGRHLSLKSLRSIAAPLVTRVDAGAASAVLARPNSRLTMIDAGVSEGVKRRAAELRDACGIARRRREDIERELEARVLPSSFRSSLSSADDANGGREEDQIELLGHWVEELDAFEKRMNNFRELILSSQIEWNSNDSHNDKVGLIGALQSFRESSWSEYGHESDDADSSYYAKLRKLQEEMKVTESQLTSAHSAHDMLASLSSANSAAVALEATRKMLYSISGDDDSLSSKTEKTHELLNGAEEALRICAGSIDGDSESLIPTLENLMNCIGVSMEDMEGVMADWSALARKHGISPYSLTKCHMALREELDGSEENKDLLPQARKREEIALEKFRGACNELTDARESVSSMLSEAVTQLMPSLGLEGASFVVHFGKTRRCTDALTGALGVDTVQFLLLNHKRSHGHGKEGEIQRGGSIEQVGSSGEKSRILLAIETSLPGSIGATCNTLFSVISDTAKSEPIVFRPSPISIIYDEIDAHVGGRAAVTIARLLVGQTRQHSEGLDPNVKLPCNKAGDQIIAITHSASVAAIADKHIVIERAGNRGMRVAPVRALIVDGTARRKELARMAAGDLAQEEAEIFADALIRDGLLQRKAISLNEIQ